MTPRELHESAGVVARAVAGAEAGHGEGEDAFARHRQRVESLAGDEQGQRRIEAAGDADGHRRFADVFQALGQPGDLRLKNLLAAFAQLFVPCGTNGWASMVPAQIVGAA